MAIALGPIVGGALLEQSSWSSIFFVMAPVAAVALAFVGLTVPRSRDPQRPPLDLPGFALSTAAMALLIFTIIEAPNHGWSSTRTLGSFALAALLAGAFARWELRAHAPMLDIGLFRNLRFTAASSAVTVSFFTLLGFIFLVTQYFQFFKGYSPLSAGVRLLPVAVSVGVASVLGTKLAVRYGTKLVVTVGLAAMAGFYGWASTTTVGTSYPTIALQMVIYGIGMGLTSAPATEAIMGAVPRAKAGVGSAVNDATRLLGGTLGVAIIGSVYASLYGSRLSADLPHRLPASLADSAHRSAGAALTLANTLGATGHPGIAQAVRDATANAFTHGLGIGCLVAGGVAASGAVVAALLLPAHPGEEPGSVKDERATPVVIELPQTERA
jgi:hypothetical protein